ncbi:branched-chain amino acid ABC transporter permease [Neobacillus niacini]|uniref:branched-chain amino acid ABC transporter permease n=1 Tax=Neobacillus niacini TaxID=86668 RepID=UPI0021CB8460|nr:branched-chain amino acid ABC transporter permease [Neobacillus niacini]MCM3766201.1 branched-chain amino acid ABC transporter permease [Neobacillus niacini]
MGQIIISGILLGGIYAIVSYGLTLIFGVIRVINFAHGSLLMVGMFMAYYLSKGMNLNIYLMMLIVVPLMFILGVLIQKYLLSKVINEPDMQLFVTFGLLLLFENVMLAVTKGEFFSLDMNMGTIPIGSLVLDWGRLINLVAAIVLAILLLLFLNHTKIGWAIRAVSQNRYAAGIIGLRVERLYILAFGLGSACIGIAAVLLTPIYTIFPHVGFNFVIVSFAVVILGGLGSIPGALAGGMIIGLLESLSGYLIAPELNQIVWYLLFLLVLFFRPAGLFGIAGSEEGGVK